MLDTNSTVVQTGQMNSDHEQQIRQRLQHFRKAARLTQCEVAAEVAVSRQAISNWERSGSLPSVMQLAKLCECYGVSSDLILYGEPTVAFGTREMLALIQSRVAEPNHGEH